MKIAINAISVKEGGPAVVLEKLLAHFVALRPDCEYHVIASARLGICPPLDLAGVKTFRFPVWERNLLLIFLWYSVVLPVWLLRRRIDVLFSQTNYLPLFAPVRTVLLEQHAGYFCDMFDLREQRSARDRLADAVKKLWVFRSLRVADRVTVQTQALADRILARWPSLARRIKVIPHGPGFLDGAPAPWASRRGGAESLEILYVAKFGEQKNFTVLLAAIEKLAQRGICVRLYLTLAPENPGTPGVLAEVAKRGLSAAVVNHGEVTGEALTSLYRAADVFVFPSICESFGFPMVEALAFGLPVVAADTPGNREICGPAAAYFPAHDSAALAAQLERYHLCRADLARSAAASRARAEAFDWKRSAWETLRWVTGEEA